MCRLGFVFFFYWVIRERVCCVFRVFYGLCIFFGFLSFFEFIFWFGMSINYGDK